MIKNLKENRIRKINRNDYMYVYPNDKIMKRIVITNEWSKAWNKQNKDMKSYFSSLLSQITECLVPNFCNDRSEALFWRKFFTLFESRFFCDDIMNCIAN